MNGWKKKNKFGIIMTDIEISVQNILAWLAHSDSTVGDTNTDISTDKHKICIRSTA